MSRRIRHHLDPFKVRIQLGVRDWIEKYKLHGGPLCLDIGSAKGDFMAGIANRFPGRFIIGVELRSKMVEKYYPLYRELPNCILLNGNINLSLPDMFAGHTVEAAYINFPDPYSKKRRHEKRRMITPELIEALGSVMRPLGNIFLQSDDLPVFTSCHELLCKKFRCITDNRDAQSVENSTGAQSAWEKECLKKNIQIYRMIYKKE